MRKKNIWNFINCQQYMSENSCFKIFNEENIPSDAESGEVG